MTSIVMRRCNGEPVLSDAGRSAPLRDVKGVFQILNASCKERERKKKTRPIFGAILALQSLNIVALLHVR